MLIAQDRPPAPLRRANRLRAIMAAAISAALHAAAALILLLPPGRALPPPTPPLEIELVQQAAEIRGAPPPPAATPAPETPANAAAPADPAPPLPRSPQAQGAAAVSAPSASAPQARRPAPRAAPEVNLGNGTQDVDPLSVTGDNVVPPGPDARYRNLPPRYPAAAARIGAEGTVQLVARISPNGLPLSVAVVESSGYSDLDEEARRAVSLWRFRPAIEGGRAVPYDYTVNIRFALGDR